MHTNISQNISPDYRSTELPASREENFSLFTKKRKNWLHRTGSIIPLYSLTQSLASGRHVSQSLVGGKLFNVNVIVWVRIRISEYQAKLELDWREMYQPRQVDDGLRLPAKVEEDNESLHLLFHHGADHNKCCSAAGNKSSD